MGKKSPRGVKIIPPRERESESSDVDMEATSSAAPMPGTELVPRPRKLAFKKPKKRIVKKKPAASVPVKEKKVEKKAAVKARPKYKRGKRPFVPEVDSVCVPMQEMPTPEELRLLGLEKEAHESGYRTARDRMEMAMQQVEQATPSAVKTPATAKATAQATAKATAQATAKDTAQATATATAPATAPATAWRAKPYSWPPARSLRSSTQVGVPLRELYQNLPPSSTAYAQSELGREAPKTPPKGPATVPTKAKSEVDPMETWGKWQPLSPAKALPPPAPVPPAAPTAVSLEQRERPVARPVTLADLKRLEAYPTLLALAQEALLRGPWVLNVGATDIPWIVGRQFVGQNEVQSFDSNLIQQQNASYATTCAHGRPFGSSGATTGTNGRSFGPSDTTTGADDSSSAKGTSTRAYGSTCSCKRVCTTKVASGKRASCESPSEGGACESHAGGDGALGFGPRLKAEILDVKDVWEKGEFAFQNISSGHMQLQRQRKIGHTRELASACSLSGRVGCSLLSCVGRVGCAADMSTRVFKFPKSRPQRAQYEKERQSSLTMYPAECVLHCKARVEARVRAIDPPEGSPEGYPEGFIGSSVDASAGLYTGLPEEPQDGFIGSPEISEECMCSPHVQVPQPGFPKKGFKLRSLKKSTFGPQLRSSASTSLVTLTSYPQPSAEARCPVFERHHCTSITCVVGQRFASECAPGTSVLHEQTCHVGCVELVELVGKEVGSRCVAVDQLEHVVQSERSKQVVLGCVGWASRLVVLMV